MLKLIHASKIYAKNGICALNAVDLTVQDGDYISVTGASGSGKSTLMHILGLLDSLTDGEYLLDGAAVAHLPAKQRARLRSEKIGFVFQQFRLLTGMTGANARWRFWSGLACPIGRITGRTSFPADSSSGWQSHGRS